MEPIRIIYFSDALCVWAYIAQNRSQQAFDKATWVFRSAFFTQLADISDRQVQFEIAENLALPIDLIQAQIDSGEAYALLSKDFDLVKEHYE